MTNKRLHFTKLFSLIFLGLASFLSVSGKQVSNNVVEDVEQVSFTLENSLVYRYLQHSNTVYGNDIGRIGTSVLCYWLLGEDVSPYMNEVPKSEGLPMWAEQCAPVVLPSITGGSLLISRTPNFENFITISSESDSVNIYNLIPQTVYWYKIMSPEDQMLTNGIFKTQGHLRMIKTEKVLNVRDIGGWKCDGGRLAYGKIFRGATLEGINNVGPVEEVDIEELVTNVGIGSEVDLRKDASISSSPLGVNVEYKKFIIDGYMYLMENINPGSTINSGNYYEIFATFVEYIIGNMKSNKGTYIHCKWGADRTGTVIAILEALCGVSEADIVKDWELTSFNAAGYEKYINIQDYYYYTNSKGEFVAKPTELRAMMEYLYNNYGGSSGTNVKEQVIAWLKDKVYCDLPDKGESIIQEIRNLLIEPERLSPVIIKDLSYETGFDYYSCTYDSTTYWESNVYQLVNPTEDSVSESDYISTTDYVLCKGYSKLLLNVVGENIAAFYDEDKKYIGGLKDASIAEAYTKETVLFDYREYDIPSNAVYVKFNMEMYSGWTAVLSEGSILK